MLRLVHPAPRREGNKVSFINLHTKLGGVVLQLNIAQEKINHLEIAISNLSGNEPEIVKEALEDRRDLLSEQLEEIGHAYQIILDKADKYDRLPEAPAPMEEYKLKTEG